MFKVCFIMIIVLVILTTYIVVCSCLHPLEQTDNVEMTRTKRSLWGGAKPTGKPCLNFCNAVHGICGHGQCELDQVSCAIRCKCESGYTGKWCSVIVKASQVNNQDLNQTISPLVMKSISTLPTHSSTSNKPNDSTTAVRSESVIDHTINTENVSRSVIKTTESILNKSSVYDSLKGCKTKCISGQCLNLNGFIRCFPIRKKSGDNETKGPSSSCPPGFSCDHGECEMQKNNIIFCRCERNWAGDLCHQHCPLECGPNGYCIIVDHTSNLPGCRCDTRYTGSRCEEIKPTPIEEEEVRHWYAIGVCVVVLFILILMMIILPYWMWRKRLLFIIKIVHYFQQYEEDDGKEYDAFISYKSTNDDEKFVLEQLYPKLEKEMGFKLCMHFRDFIPGDAIANNIIRAIENSRRTIMVLSPNYIDSEWCRMEYQKAQHEMLKMKHKIIPVVLEDISKSKFIDKNLKTILNTVTYLEWPGFEQTKKLERFWKHLQLSMPKKHSCTRAESLPFGVVSSSPSQEHLFSRSSVSLSQTTDESEIMSSLNNDSSAISSDNNLSNDQSTGRLQRVMKNIKLRINTEKPFVHQENSSESCTSTPITTTPSPGVFLVRDNSPLIKSKDHKRNKQTKSSTWSPSRHTDPKIQGLTQYNSLREADKCSIIAVVPQIQCCVNSQRENLPDLCKTCDGGYLNIVCEAESPPPSPENNVTDMESYMKKQMNCPTCILNCDIDNNNVLGLQRTTSMSSTEDNYVVEERECKILEMNIPYSKTNQKILNIDETFTACVFCNDKTCVCYKRSNVNNNSTSVSVEDNCIIDLPVAPVRRKRNRPSLTRHIVEKDACNNV